MRDDNKPVCLWKAFNVDCLLIKQLNENITNKKNNISKRNNFRLSSQDHKNK